MRLSNARRLVHERLGINMTKKSAEVLKKEQFKENFKKEVRSQAKMLYRKTLEEVSDRHKFVAVAYAVKDIVIDQWIANRRNLKRKM